MNKFVYIFVAVIIGASIAFAGCTKEAKALNVNEIGADPAAFTGTITVAGIMAGVAPTDPNVIGIMDLKELQCKSPGCNKIIIPVKCTGAKPALGDEIKVTGSFSKLPEGYLFTADKIKVVQSHKIGG